MKYKPHNYQAFASEFILEHPVCCLMLDMGLGKTVITLTALWELVLDRFDVSRILVIAPKRVAEDTWPKEIAKWEHLSGLSFSLVLGSRADREAALRKRAFIYIINRENVAWLVENYRWDFDMVVIDELSSFKSNKAERFKAMKCVRPKVSRIIGLTGTPAPNSLLDLWPQMYLLDMGQRLGRFIGGFRDRFFVPDKRNREIIYSYKPRDGAEDTIYSLVSDICISMKAVDYLDIPERIDNRIEVVMSAKEQKLYDDFQRDMVLAIEGEELDAVNAAALSNKLLQMANGAVYGDDRKVLPIHDRKLDALEDLVEAANGKPLLVAYWYKHDLQRIQARFKNARCIDTSKDIDDWNAGKISLALIHPASAGHGLNLQEGGCTIVWFGLTWSLELYQQLNARLWRQGQKHTVVIHHIVTKGTHDEDVMRALGNKDMRQSALIEAVRARIGGSGMRERIETLIRDYPKNKMELKCLEHQIRNFRGITEEEMIDTMYFTQPEGERVQTNGVSDKTARIAMSYRERMDAINQEWYQHLEKQYVSLAEEVGFFESAVKALQGKMGEVMQDMIFSQASWDDLAEKHYVSRRTIGRYRQKAIDDLVVLYEKHEAEMLAYMLS